MKKLDPAKLVKLISEAYQKKQGVFKHRVNAEDHIPKNCTDLEKTLFLFYTIQLDYSIKSQNLYLGSKELWSLNKRYFYPKVILELNTSKLEELLKMYLKPRYINEAVKRWKYNSQKLIKEYNGNPLKIFSSTNDSITIMKRIYDFRGFGPKIGNFFFRAMLNTFNLKLLNINEERQPVDLHDIRLTYE